MSPMTPPEPYDAPGPPTAFLHLEPRRPSPVIAVARSAPFPSRHRRSHVGAWVLQPPKNTRHIQSTLTTVFQISLAIGVRCRGRHGNPRPFVLPPRLLPRPLHPIPPALEATSTRALDCARAIRLTPSRRARRAVGLAAISTRTRAAPDGARPSDSAFACALVPGIHVGSHAAEGVGLKLSVGRLGQLAQGPLARHPSLSAE